MRAATFSTSQFLVWPLTQTKGNMTLNARLVQLGICGLCGLVCFFGSGCKPDEAVQPPPRPVRAVRLSDLPALASRSFPGTAESVDAVEMSFRVGGPMVAFPANELGKKVSKGDLLAQIDSRDFEVRLRDAQANLAKARAELDAMRKARPEDIEKLKAGVERAQAAADYARAEYKRYLSLIKSNAASESEVELAQARAKLADAEVVQAKESLTIGEQGARPEDIKAKESEIASLQAAVETAQDQLSDTRLLAPFDGAVSSAYVQNYEVVQPKQPIVRLVNTSELEIRVDIPENLIALVPQVREAFVTVQAFPDTQIPARIAEVGTEASPTTRTYPVKLRFTPPPGVEVRPGMTGVVRGRGNSQSDTASTAQIVPATAVFDRGDKTCVWIYDPESKAVHAQNVKVLGTTPYGLSVSGVKLEQWIVTAGVHYLEENQQVRLLSDSEANGDKT